MSNAKNQHWVPQFYLRRFAVPGWRDKEKAKIWVMDIATGKTTIRKIREIASEEFLYSHVKIDGSRCFQVEEQLSEIETMTARFWGRLVDGFPDLSAAWGIKKLAALFIGSLVLRHPDVETVTRGIHGEIVSIHDRLPKDAKGRPAVSHIFENGEAFEFDNSDYDEFKAADPNRFKQMFAEQIRPVAMKMAEVLFAKRWAFFCTDHPSFFTSDKPVIAQHPVVRKFGVETPGVNLWFPISPTRMLWMSDPEGDRADGFYPLPVSEAAPLNAFTIANATRFVLSDEPPDARMQEVDALVDEPARCGPPRPLAGPIWMA
jgi:Protein of unknown function (DUF4238)